MNKMGRTSVLYFPKGMRPENLRGIEYETPETLGRFLLPNPSVSLERHRVHTYYINTGNIIIWDYSDDIRIENEEAPLVISEYTDLKKRRVKCIELSTKTSDGLAILACRLGLPFDPSGIIGPISVR